METSNVTGFSVLPMYARFFWRALGLLVKAQNRRIRKLKQVSPVDALFNFAKLSILESVMLKYRFMVRFGEQTVIDSTFPPYPSKAFDKRLTNYINNLDLVELPSGIVSISTTNCCPYGCAFCSVDARRRNPEMDLDEELVKRTIRHVERIGVPSIILHGGEPMFRYDRFLRMVKHVSDETCLWMFTTGYGVTDERAAELKRNGLFGVWVSLDHHLPERHNRLRGHAEAFDNAVRAVESFKKAGVYTCLSLVPPEDFLETENFKKYYDMARDMGVAEIRVMEVKPSGREACKGVVPHSPVLENLQQDLHKDPKYRDYPPLSGLSTWLEKDPAFGCQCRFEYLFITAAGDVQPCEVSEISFGNITEEEFPVIYDRIRKAFPKPATGCIPMVMYPEIRNYQKVKENLTTAQKADLASAIMEGFQEKGKIPGAYELIWSTYQRRVALYRRRRQAEAKRRALPN